MFQAKMMGNCNGQWHSTNIVLNHNISPLFLMKYLCQGHAWIAFFVCFWKIRNTRNWTLNTEFTIEAHNTASSNLRGSSESCQTSIYCLYLADVFAITAKISATLRGQLRWSGIWYNSSKTDLPGTTDTRIQSENAAGQRLKKCNTLNIELKIFKKYWQNHAQSLQYMFIHKIILFSKTITMYNLLTRE